MKRPALIAAFALAALLAAPAAQARPPKIDHVFTIVLENKAYDSTFGPAAEAPYLSRTLVDKGALLTQYYGTGHASLGNYITMISGQSEAPATQADCPTFSDFTLTGIAPGNQAIGDGCVYPAQIKTIANQLDKAHLGWRAYMQDMGNDPARESTTCGHPAIGAPDMTLAASATDQYATRHDPFVYFHSIIDKQAKCDKHVVRLEKLRHDLRKERTTPSYAFITPDLCADGHDPVCADPSQPGGYAGIDAFLREWAPRILKSKAMKHGLLAVLFDEGTTGDACCFMPTGPNVAQQGRTGPGGGLTGAVLVSPEIKPGTVSSRPYNHYSFLRSTEDIFGLGHLGYAAEPASRPFGRDVFTAHR